MPTFKADLSTSSLDVLLKDLVEYQEKVVTLPERLTSELAQTAATSISENLTGITDLDGNAPGTIEIKQNGTSATVSNVGDQIAYLEYGTGAYADPHPQAGQVGWTYGEGERIFTTKSGRRMWHYWDDMRGHWRTTAGQQPNMQVFKAALKTRQEIVPTAKRLMK